MKPSERGELEITSLNEMYLNEDRLEVVTLGRGYAWLDTGTMDSLFEASNFVRTIENTQGILVSVCEEIAFQNGWITIDQLAAAAKEYGKSPYGEHLQKVVENKIKQTSED